MKSILISIRPEWCAHILSGQKTVEVRKTKPKINTPFKCYIYCTQLSPYNPSVPYSYPTSKCTYSSFLTSSVIGEFICDRIVHLDMDSVGVGFFEGKEYIYLDDIGWNTKLTKQEFMNYAGGKRVYGWHISDLVIYDKPKKLSDFHRHCIDSFTCELCVLNKNNHCENTGLYLTRPPQSWCYV